MTTRKTTEVVTRSFCQNRQLVELHVMDAGDESLGQMLALSS